MSINQAATYHLDIVSAEKKIFSGQVKSIRVMGSSGALSILRNHIPLLTTIKPGIARIMGANNEENFLYLTGGILEVQPCFVTILADTVLRSLDLDEQKARQAKKEAEASMTESSSNSDKKLAAIALAEAVEKLKIIAQLKKYQL